jgi:uncharacterized FlgJ-related protein
MSPAIIEILVLAGIAIFLVLRLKNVLGTREGFEKPPLQESSPSKNNRDFRVIDGGEDTDITDNIDKKPIRRCFSAYEKSRQWIFSKRIFVGRKVSI